VAVAETKGEATATSVKRTSRTEKTTTTTIKRIVIIVTITAVGGMITGDVVLFNVAENRVKKEVMVPVTETLTISIDAGIDCFKIRMYTSAIFKCE